MKNKYLILLLLTACSWQAFNPFDEKGTVSDKAIKNFDLDKEIVDKFSTQTPTVEENPNTAETKNPQTKTVAQEKVSSKKTSSKNKDKKQIKIESINKINGINYPDGYPEEFMKMDKDGLELWKKIKPKNIVGELTSMTINYMGVVVGKIAISVNPNVKIGDQEVYHYYAKMQSAPFYKYIYTLDDVIESYVRVSDYLPIKYTLIQRESKQSIDDIQLFDREKFMTYFRLKKEKKGKTSFKKADEFIPYYYQDALSALFMLKFFPFKIGEKLQFPIVTRGKISLMKVEVAGIETIYTKIGSVEAFKLKANTQYSGDLVKSGEMTYWISTDEHRKFLKFEAEIKMGRVVGEIESYKNP